MSWYTEASIDDESCARSREAKEITKSYGSLTTTMTEFIEAAQCLVQGVEDVSQAKLKQPLLRREENGLIAVNFDPELVRLLREVKYSSSNAVPPPLWS